MRQRIEKVVSRIIDWYVPYLQVVILIATFVLIYWLHGADILNKLLVNMGNVETVDTFKYYVIARAGNIVAAMVASLIMLFCIRKYNKEKSMPSGKEFHDHYYIGYWFCAKILGYQNCNLRLIPNPMQFKLIINETFSDFIYDEGVHDNPDVNNHVVVESWNLQSETETTKTANLLIEDTYKITKEQLPDTVAEYPSFQIKNDRKNDSIRYKNESLIKGVVNIIKKMTIEYDVINVFPTLNASNCYHIAKEAFPIRSEIRKRVYVFWQGMDNTFSQKGYRVF